MVSNIFGVAAAPQDEVLVKLADNQLTRKALACLQYPQWLAADVMDAYMALLQNRARKNNSKRKFFPTHFYQMISKEPYVVNNGLPYVREQDLFEWEYFYIPINVESSHWVLLIVGLREQAIYALDSLPTKQLTKQLDTVARFFSDVARLRPAAPTNISKWERRKKEGIPTQRDGHSCGVFVLLYAEMHSRPAPILIDPESVAEMRNRIAVDLVTLNIVRD